MLLTNEHFSRINIFLFIDDNVTRFIKRPYKVLSLMGFLSKVIHDSNTADQCTLLIKLIYIYSDIRINKI